MESRGQGAAPPIHVHKTGRGKEPRGQGAASPIHVQRNKIVKTGGGTWQGDEQNVVARVQS